MEKKKGRRRSSISDDLSIVKAAAWAWYQHGSGSQESSMREFDAKLTRLQSPKPSRYKIEAIKITKQPSLEQYSSLVTIHTNHDRNDSQSLLDAYEVERITKQLDNLVLSSSKRFNEVDDKQVDRAPNSSKLLKNKNTKKNSLLKLIWWRHSVVCGSREDVNSGALVRTKPLPAAAGGRVRGDS